MDKKKIVSTIICIVFLVVSIDNLKLINKVPLGEMSIFFDFNANLEIDSLVLVT
ncbi:immunity protein PncM [Streptococcus pneumoniae]|nr:immunity protein PncM [Streptococcus pneumoniae]